MSKNTIYKTDNTYVVNNTQDQKICEIDNDTVNHITDIDCRLRVSAVVSDINHKILEALDHVLVTIKDDKTLYECQPNNHTEAVKYIIDNNQNKFEKPGYYKLYRSNQNNPASIFKVFDIDIFVVYESPKIKQTELFNLIQKSCLNIHINSANNIINSIITNNYYNKQIIALYEVYTNTTSAKYIICNLAIKNIC